MSQNHSKNVEFSIKSQKIIKKLCVCVCLQTTKQLYPIILQVFCVCAQPTNTFIFYNCPNYLRTTHTHKHSPCCSPIKNMLIWFSINIPRPAYQSALFNVVVAIVQYMGTNWIITIFIYVFFYVSVLLTVLSGDKHEKGKTRG